jgi:hypothetical protein
MIQSEDSMIQSKDSMIQSKESMIQPSLGFNYSLLMMIQ